MDSFKITGQEFFMDENGNVLASHGRNLGGRDQEGQFGTTEISWYGSKFSTFLIFEPTEVFWYGVHYFGDTQ